MSDMESFTDQAKIILPVLGVDALRMLPTPAEAVSDLASGGSLSPTFEMTIASAGILATAQEADGEFAMLERATARAGWVGASRYDKLQSKLFNDGTLVLNGSHARVRLGTSLGTGKRRRPEFNAKAAGSAAASQHRPS